MAVETWITPEETPALAEAAKAAIEAKLCRFSPAERAAFWASVRKCYNTPYNDPAPRAAKTATIMLDAIHLVAADGSSTTPSEVLVIGLPMTAIAAAAPPAEFQAA